jgi:hypothetical protein
MKHLQKIRSKFSKGLSYQSIIDSHNLLRIPFQKLFKQTFILINIQFIGSLYV